MSSFWETKYLNSERSIQFIQTAHSEVLKGLHSEIENLQKQCADYALRLSLQASTSAEKVKKCLQNEIEEYDKKFKSFNSEYKKKDALINEQKKLIDERNKSIKALEERVKTLEKKYETDNTAKDNQIKQYKAQLESQSLQIANLTFQIHHLSKSKVESKKSDDILNESKILNSPKLSKTIKSYKINTNDTSSLSSSIKDDASLTNSINTKLNKLKISDERKISADSHREALNLNLKEIDLESNDMPLKRPTSSNSNSGRSDRSSTPPINKLLPPVIKRASEIIPPPDPKPFLQSAASTLHTRSRKDYLQRKALISLPPIKPYELNQLVVESPIKISQIKNNSLIPGSSTHDHNNNANKD